MNWGSSQNSWGVEGGVPVSPEKGKEGETEGAQTPPSTSTPGNKGLQPMKGLWRLEVES
jgi:hypothetical protein